MSQKVFKIVLFFCILCLIFILINDVIFFWYVKTFSLKIEPYVKIDRFLDDSIPFLAIPASFALFHLLKLKKLGTKIKIIFYIFYGLILPFLIFRAFPMRFGQLSNEYLSFSLITINRLYFKIAFITLIAFHIFTFLAEALDFIKDRGKKSFKLLLKTLGISVLSIVLSFSIVVISVTQVLSLIDRLLLVNKVTDTLPQLKNYTNQEIIITDEPKALIKCYLEENPKDLGTHLLNLVVDSSSLIEIGYNSYYFNNHCLVVYIGLPLTLEKDSATTSAALLSELLIRTTFGNQIHLNTNKHPAETIQIKKEEEFKPGDSRGVYDTDANKIKLQQGYDRVFETITHELMHSFSNFSDSWAGYQGMNEAITQYFTARIMNRFSGVGSYNLYIYKNHVEAFKELLKYIDEKRVTDVYFNGNLKSLEKEVDSKTYPGAYCQFNHYLNKSIIEYLDSQNFKLSEENSTKAIKALKVKGDGDFDC